MVKQKLTFMITQQQLEEAREQRTGKAPQAKTVFFKLHQDKKKGHP